MVTTQPKYHAQPAKQPAHIELNGAGDSPGTGGSGGDKEFFSFHRTQIMAFKQDGRQYRKFCQFPFCLQRVRGKSPGLGDLPIFRASVIMKPDVFFDCLKEK